MTMTILTILCVLLGVSIIWLYNNVAKADKLQAECALSIKKANASLAELDEKAKVLSQQTELHKATLEKELVSYRTSVNYAEKIQRTVIPSPSQVKAAFPESFVYFAPKDVVSGDFYYMARLKNFTVMVVADCTGHGVPGGFLSMLGITGLKDLLGKYNDAAEISTSDVLTRLRQFVINSLSETIEEDDSMSVSDGMDMTMVAFANDLSKIYYSLADHTLYVARGGKVNKLKGDRMPIGRHPNQDVPFQQFEFDLQAGDVVYLCSDGVQDQIGGPDNCKFMTKRLVPMLQSIADKDMQKQYDEASAVINSWKDGYEQVDDQTLIGIRIAR